jgi:quercetin dioxygenase-like cupin family protein
MEGDDMAAKPKVHKAGEGDQRWFAGGGMHTWKVTTEDSDGAFFLFEDELTEGKMTPWHCHPETDETIYVLEGELDVNVDGDEQRITAGGMWLAPRGVPHAFTVLSPVARLLSFHVPGRAQSFYWDASTATTNGDRGPVDFDRVREVAAATGATTVLGPPPFVTH